MLEETKERTKEYIKAHAEKYNWENENKDTKLEAANYNVGLKTGYEDGFQDGVNFGYNKANEWHKPSEKLPEECTLVLAYAFEDTEPSLYYFVASNYWEWMPRRIACLDNDQIRIWKEIVLPELKESEE